MSAQPAQDPKKKAPATQQAPTGPKILRIGIIQGGRIIEERLIRLGEPVTVGSDEKNTVVVPNSPLGARFELFSPRGTQYDLQYTDQMQGKVSHADQVKTIASLAQGGVAKKGKTGAWRLPLDERTRGKVYAGDPAAANTYVFLFQFVAAPPQAKRSALDFRAWRWEDVDWIFLGFVLGSALLHTAFIIWTESQPPPKKVTLEDFPDRIVKIMLPNKKEEKKVEAPKEDKPSEEKKAEEPKPAEESKPAEEAKPAEEPKDEPAGPPPKTDEQLKAEAAAAVQSKGMLALLTSRRGTGAVADLLSDGSGVSAAVAQGLAASSGAGIASSESDAGLKGGGGKDGAAGIGAVGGVGTGAGGDAGATKQQKAPEAIVKEETISLANGDAGSLRSVVKRYMGRIKACYESELRSNPDLAGKISVSWIVGADGRTSDVSIAENTMGNAAVASCITKVIGGITFPGAEEEIEVQAYPFVFSAQ